jgi:hypothetical protein
MSTVETTVLNNIDYKHQSFSLRSTKNSHIYTVCNQIQKKFRHAIHQYLDSDNPLHHRKFRFRQAI